MCKMQFKKCYKKGNVMIVFNFYQERARNIQSVDKRTYIRSPVEFEYISFLPLCCILWYITHRKTSYTGVSAKIFEPNI
jgi:hypothetical protein